MDEIRGNYIKLHRSLLEWEWFQDDKTLVVFLYLLLRANWKPNRWRGIAIDRGQTLENLAGIADATGLSVRSVRTALNHLKSTGEVTEKLTRYGRLINVVNYAKYQDVPLLSDKESDKQTDNEVTRNRQGSDKEVTILEEGKEIKNDKKVRNREGLRSPSLPEVERYFKEHGYKAEPFPFWEYYNRREWKDQNGRQLDWMLKAGDWEAREKQIFKGEERIVIPDPFKNHNEDDTGEWWEGLLDGK